MRELSSNELHLKGRVQVETALGALAHTGINPKAQQRLQTLLDAHKSESDGVSQTDLSIYSQGGTVERDKSDIVASLDALADSKTATAETRLAATALREIL